MILLKFRFSHIACMNFMFIMYMLCFCTLCSYATCEWPEFYVNKDMFRSVLFIFKRFGKQSNEQICLNSSPIFFIYLLFCGFVVFVVFCFCFCFLKLMIITIFFKTIFHNYHLNVKRSGSRSGPTFCRA